MCVVIVVAISPPKGCWIYVLGSGDVMLNMAQGKGSGEPLPGWTGAGRMWQHLQLDVSGASWVSKLWEVK